MDIVKGPLVFLNNPMNIGSPDLHALVLQEDVTINRSVISHERWLDLPLKLANEQGLTDISHNRLPAKVIIQDLKVQIFEVKGRIRGKEGGLWLQMQSMYTLV